MSDTNPTLGEILQCCDSCDDSLYESLQALRNAREKLEDLTRRLEAVNPNRTDKKE